MRPGPPPIPLPAGLPAAFPVRAAVGTGVSPERLRAADLDASVWGVRTRARQTEFVERCRALLTRMPPHAFISHVSALRLHGSPLPARFDEQTVDLAFPAPHRAPHAARIRGHRLEIAAIDRRRGLPVSLPTSAWAEAASQLTIPELVGVGDFLIGGGRPIADIPELVAAIGRRPAHLAGRRMRVAVELLDGRAESYPESLLRATLRLAGLPAPAVNEPIRVGTRIYRPDLMYRAQRVIIEYQGDHHREREQWRADLRRRTELEGAGWTVIEVTWSDIEDPSALIARLGTLGIR